MPDIKPEDVDHSKLPWWIPRWSVGWFLMPNRINQISKFVICIGVIAFAFLVIKVLIYGIAPGSNQSIRVLLIFPTLGALVEAMLWILQYVYGQKSKYLWVGALSFLYFSNLQESLRAQSLPQSLRESLIGLLFGVITILVLQWYDHKSERT